MLKGFLPKEFAFYDSFEKHMSLVSKVCKLFYEQISNTGDGKDYLKQINEYERLADEVTYSTTEALHRTFITPIERTDIYSLVKRIDDIADFIQSASSRIVLYEIKEIRKEAIQLADILLTATSELEIAIKALRNFKNSELIKEKCKIVHELEDKADDILKIAVAQLFRENDAMNMIKWKEILEKIEKAIDRCQSLARIIEGVLIDNA